MELGGCIHGMCSHLRHDRHRVAHRLLTITHRLLAVTHRLLAICLWLLVLNWWHAVPTCAGVHGWLLRPARHSRHHILLLHVSRHLVVIDLLLKFN